MEHEDVPAHLELRLIQTDVTAVASKQPVATEPTNAETDVVADDGARNRSKDDARDGEIVCRTGIHSGGDQHGLAWEWHSEALDPDEKEYNEVAVCRQQVGEAAVHCGVSGLVPLEAGIARHARRRRRRSATRR